MQTANSYNPLLTIKYVIDLNIFIDKSTIVKGTSNN